MAAGEYEFSGKLRIKLFAVTFFIMLGMVLVCIALASKTWVTGRTPGQDNKGNEIGTTMYVGLVELELVFDGPYNSCKEPLRSAGSCWVNGFPAVGLYANSMRDGAITLIALAVIGFISAVASPILYFFGKTRDSRYILWASLFCAWLGGVMIIIGAMAYAQKNLFGWNFLLFTAVSFEMCVMISVLLSIAREYVKGNSGSGSGDSS